jgi:chromosome transmission fidelity protein 18
MGLLYELTWFLLTVYREEHQHYRRKMKKKKQIQAESQALWVEKYRPSIFMDLLGDQVRKESYVIYFLLNPYLLQRVNRDALRWVKQWDYCVFGKKPQHESQRDKALRQYKATFGNTMGQQYEKKYDKQANDNNNNAEKVTSSPSFINR